jgi:3-oxoadipate enol-lactonase
MPRIAVDDIELYYELHGPADGEVLVLSNGVLMSTASWAYQTAVLARHVGLLLYDCRGMWQSDHPPGPYSMSQHAADLAALLDALDIGQAHIGGVSYGAEISMVFAHRYPERTRSLILASAVSHIEPLLAGWTGSWMAAAEAHDPDLLFHVTYPLNFSEAWIAANQDALAAARQRYEELDFDAFRELLECFGRLDITADLKEITAPTLVIAGEDDLLKPRPYSETIARQIPEAELVVIPHAGHAVMWEQPGVFNTLVLGFVTRHAGGK